MGETIKEEISKAPFVALMLDETTDVSNAAQLSFVLRFVTDSGVKERFVKFEDVTGKKRAEDVAAMALGFLEEHGCMGKLVAQCYDGAAVMASGLNGVQAKVKEKIPQALFIHCYAHALNLVLFQGVVKIKECRIFFPHLSGLAAFFSRSPKRTQLLDEICQKRLPRVAPTRWNFASRLVCTVFEKKDALKDLFDYIVEHHEEFDDAAILSADGYLSNLGNFEFGFFLSTFNEIFAHADVLFDILQNKSFDMQFCLTRVEEFCICIEGQRDRFDQIYDETVQDTGLPTGRRAHGDSRSHYKKLHNGILENILNQVQNRFKDHEKLSFLSLLDPQQFTSFNSNFPETAFASLTESYGPHFDLSRLKTELSVMYGIPATAGPSASSAVLQAVTAALAERPSRYGRPCLGGDCGCNLNLRGAGLAMYRALLHRDSLFWRGNSWSVNVSGGCVCGRYNSLQRGVAGVVRFQHLPSRSAPVFAECNRITSRNLEADFFEALDQHTPRFIQLFKSKKGSVGQKLQSINWPDTTRDEALSSVTVGVLTVLSEDSPQEGPSSMQLEPISTDIVRRSPKMHGKYSEVRSNSDAWTGNQSSLT
ncbi:hypothetical protein JOQ06_001498 [Pogonophryne albipinna]|uniref:DUF4371 domain-containing protein n=1 Tax=Pogonophryne albipinna TaxID=1090488 RepID=A0AAD6B587_9TELE|nr:hypothetical protein JOQ06_001498 [Pogonophryne albipinna]